MRPGDFFVWIDGIYEFHHLEHCPYRGFHDTFPVIHGMFRGKTKWNGNYWAKWWQGEANDQPEKLMGAGHARPWNGRGVFTGTPEAQELDRLTHAWRRARVLSRGRLESSGLHRRLSPTRLREYWDLMGRLDAKVRQLFEGRPGPAPALNVDRVLRLVRRSEPPAHRGSRRRMRAAAEPLSPDLFARSG